MPALSWGVVMAGCESQWRQENAFLADIQIFIDMSSDWGAAAKKTIGIEPAAQEVGILHTMVEDEEMTFGSFGDEAIFISIL